MRGAGSRPRASAASTAVEHDEPGRLDGERAPRRGVVERGREEPHRVLDREERRDRARRRDRIRRHDRRRTRAAAPSATATSSAVRASRPSAAMRQPSAPSAAPGEHEPDGDERHALPRLAAADAAVSTTTPNASVSTSPSASATTRGERDLRRDQLAEAAQARARAAPTTFSSRSAASEPAASSSASNPTVSVERVRLHLRRERPRAARAPAAGRARSGSPSPAARRRSGASASPAMRTKLADALHLRRLRPLREQLVGPAQPEHLELAAEELPLPPRTSSVDVVEVRVDVGALQLAVERVDERLHLAHDATGERARARLQLQLGAVAPSPRRSETNPCGTRTIATTRPLSSSRLASARERRTRSDLVRRRARSRSHGEAAVADQDRRRQAGLVDQRDARLRPRVARRRAPTSTATTSG